MDVARVLAWVGACVLLAFDRRGMVEMVVEGLVAMMSFIALIL
jgi:hypothetical protein